MKIRSLFSIIALSFGVSSVQAINYSPDNVSAELLLKVPGNDAVHHSLKFEKIPLIPQHYYKIFFLST